MKIFVELFGKFKMGGTANNTATEKLDSTPELVEKAHQERYLNTIRRLGKLQEYLVDTNDIEFHPNVREFKRKVASNEVVFHFLAYQAEELSQINNLFRDTIAIREIGTVRARLPGKSVGTINKYHVVINLKAYEKIFDSETKRFLQNHLIPTIKLLKKEETMKTELYRVIVDKYEDSIFKVYSTANKAIEIGDVKRTENGSYMLSDEMSSKIITILKLFTGEVEEATSRLEELARLEKEALSQNLLKELDDEIDFINKSIVQKHDWKIQQKEDV